MTFNRLIPLLVVLLCGCAATEPNAVDVQPALPSAMTLIDTADFGPRPEVLPLEDIFTLSASDKTDFQHFFNAPKQQKVLPHMRVFNFLRNELQSFDYDDGTFSAQQTLTHNKGNCLSLAILTTAYAKLAGIDVQYTQITSAPTFSTTGSVEVTSSHVVTKLYDPTFLTRNKTIGKTEPYIVLDYFPSRNNWLGGEVTAKAFIAMYYSNLSAQAIENGELFKAGWLAIEALKHAPEDVASINMMAVIYRKMNQSDTAERLYKHGLLLRGDDLNLLRNYHALLEQQGRAKEANRIKGVLDTIEDPSPFSWLNLAENALAKRRFNRAARHFQKAIEKANYLPYGYAGLAKVYYAGGYKKEAKKLFEMALKRTRDDKTEALYQAKLMALTGR